MGGGDGEKMYVGVAWLVLLCLLLPGLLIEVRVWW